MSVIEISPSRATIQAGWDDVPHLDETTKRELLDSTPPHLREARSKGIPALGSGAIYPVPERDILVDPFPIPDYWPRCYGFDVGWNCTAAAWLAYDRTTDTAYLNAEHKRGHTEPSIHGSAIKARGEWIPGAVDPAARGRQQGDGRQLLSMYRNLDLNIQPADNAVEAGLYAVWERLATGRLKVFRTLQQWRDEYRLYRRDEAGKVVKEHDHLMDATRYAVMTGLKIAIVRPAPKGVGRAVVSDPTAGY